jgi:hypothetical protein
MVAPFSDQLHVAAAGELLPVIVVVLPGVKLTVGEASVIEGRAFTTSVVLPEAAIAQDPD